MNSRVTTKVGANIIFGSHVSIRSERLSRQGFLTVSSTADGGEASMTISSILLMRTRRARITTAWLQLISNCSLARNRLIPTSRNDKLMDYLSYFVRAAAASLTTACADVISELKNCVTTSWIAPVVAAGTAI